MIELLGKLVNIDCGTLTDYDEETTVNVSLARGGERSNVVAESAYAEIDVRVFDDAAAERLPKQFESIAAHSTVPDTTCEIADSIMFPPMPVQMHTIRWYLKLAEYGIECRRF